MGEEILSLFIKKGFLLDKEIFDVLKKIEDAQLLDLILGMIKESSEDRIINKSFFAKNQELIQSISINSGDDNKRTIERLFIDLGIRLEITKEKVERIVERTEEIELKGLRVLNLIRNVGKKISVEDFVKHFRARYFFIRKILQERPELQNLVSINKTKTIKQFSVIGMVYKKRVTKNKNFLFEIEDPTGSAVVIINKNNSETFEKAKEILLDEIVGFKCSGGTENMLFVSDIIFPEAILFEKKKSKEEESIAFISDVHVGSLRFLEKNFLRFINWINGGSKDEEQKKEGLKVKYLFVTGDTVDGVGVYPGQESLLLIKDIKQQYGKLAELLSKIRKDIKIILCPGQHDAVRVAEPQPIVEEEFGSALYSLKNLILVTNPAFIELGNDVKFKILMYHGASLHNIIDEIEKLRFGKGRDHPTEAVKYLLKKRHLAPTHSFVTYIPNEKEDMLIIKEVPDVIATGEMHRSEVSLFNNVLLIASSCWQSITPFEEKIGNNPDPCKVPVLNLKTRQVKIFDFSGEEDS